MTIPVWVLLGFAGWTLIILSLSVGVYRWSRILTGRQGIGEFDAAGTGGADWYKRALRAHANCVENLPVYGAIVFAAYSARLDDPFLDTLACVFLAARVIQSLIHISLAQTDKVVSARFSFFFVQFACMALMGIHVATAA
ncbi:MAG TPA: MAPEG family protein [Patescibacteria group bacterium]|nr:MAPEG family protein [Patescibacteria group bacterium]